MCQHTDPGMTLKHRDLIHSGRVATRAQCQFLFYCLFQYFEEKEYQTESKRNETFGIVIFWKIIILEAWRSSQKTLEELRRQGAPPSLQGAAPYLMDPSSTSRPTSFAYICLRTLKTPRNIIDREFRRRKPL